MEAVGSRLGDHVNDSAGVAPVFGIERICQDAEFRDAVGSGLNPGGVHKQIVAIATVDIKIVGAPAASVDGDSARLIAPIEKVRSPNALNTGLQLQSLVSVTSVERQLAYSALVDDGA